MSHPMWAGQAFVDAKGREVGVLPYDTAGYWTIGCHHKNGKVCRISPLIYGFTKATEELRRRAMKHGWSDAL